MNGTWVPSVVPSVTSPPGVIERPDEVLLLCLGVVLKLGLVKVVRNRVGRAPAAGEHGCRNQQRGQDRNGDSASHSLRQCRRDGVIGQGR